MLNRILILTLAVLLVGGAIPAAAKDDGGKKVKKVVVTVEKEQQGDQKGNDAGDEAENAYVVTLKQLAGNADEGKWVVADELSPMMLIQEKELKAAHEKLLAAMESLKDSGDLSEQGMEKLQEVLKEIGEDFKGPNEWSKSDKAMRAYKLAAPNVEVKKGQAKKIIVQKQAKGDSDNQRQLTITIDGDDVKVEGEGYTDEELEQIRQAIKAGKGGVVELDGEAINLTDPGFEYKTFGDLSPEDLDKFKGSQDLSELNGKMKDLQLELKAVPGMPLPEGYVIGKSLTDNEESTEAWEKQWHELEKELGQVLSDEQMDRLNELMESRPQAGGQVASEFPELYRQELLRKWETTPEGEGNQFYFLAPGHLAPEGRGIFEWHGKQLDDEEWESELKQMMDSIEQQMREFMQQYKSQHEEDSA